MCAYLCTRRACGLPSHYPRDTMQKDYYTLWGRSLCEQCVCVCVNKQLHICICFTRGNDIFARQSSETTAQAHTKKPIKSYTLEGTIRERAPWLPHHEAAILCAVRTTQPAYTHTSSIQLTALAPTSVCMCVRQVIMCAA